MTDYDPTPETLQRPAHVRDLLQQVAALRAERDRLREAARDLVATEYYSTGIWAMVYLDKLEALAALVEPPVVDRPWSPQVTAARAAAALVTAGDDGAGEGKE